MSDPRRAHAASVIESPQAPLTPRQSSSRPTHRVWAHEPPGTQSSYLPLPLPLPQPL
eukprot:CAMPEP_0183427982 /NCGR_PEP_ID=MMETSP0370-20130417/44124_1 /TAXON_ID=268820 /ORGANISM="Peridinium aciculiferum, Strain PAER-2" /LENGTH=56 /DNA_ID=CAMNT_0025612667 /DNA_START=34 /DNA_END=201 /DNA_ORIENTATION=-